MLWQRSPETKNLPWDEYVKTEDYRRSQDALRNWERWMSERLSGRLPTRKLHNPTGETAENTIRRLR